jgi:hypothetical protein
MGEILGKIVHRTSQFIPVIQPNFSHESNAELTDSIVIKAFIGVMCLAGVLRNNNLEEIWGNKGNGTKQFD